MLCACTQLHPAGLASAIALPSVGRVVICLLIFWLVVLIVWLQALDTALLTEQSPEELLDSLGEPGADWRR